METGDGVGVGVASGALRTTVAVGAGVGVDTMAVAVAEGLGSLFATGTAPTPGVQAAATTEASTSATPAQAPAILRLPRRAASLDDDRSELAMGRSIEFHCSLKDSPASVALSRRRRQEPVLPVSSVLPRSTAETSVRGRAETDLADQAPR